MSRDDLNVALPPKTLPVLSRCVSQFIERKPFDFEGDMEVDDEIISILTHTPCSHLVQCVEDDVLDVDTDTTAMIFKEKPVIQNSKNPCPPKAISAFKKINCFN
ncbi:hypothetical protein EIN_051780 [Entamoeba invadens IP1]|uniref:hypothetical protein n=1 Tax=Entamoeba invadens IP1 TaxID=370355 RepID=UPI0002C3DE55|nr:hypothetical protein EIN_051780 [Entamoeba invadens IP1]ELP93003.1 hypothetical protein EIN_051780 [Entamoeba invadens IP1]|eukprot:XP_004259774.1 hypothetical protein EIN_051780 [Entamoeba invadens IP1]